MELNGRLRLVASLVTCGYSVADIGTDHAYIPIYLIEKGIIPFALATDINLSPLRRARENVRVAGLSDKIRLRSSDGLAAFKPGEANSLVLSGMGGNLIIKILFSHPKITDSFQECILQPQSEVAKVRSFLLEKGFLFVREDMALENGKFYPMMKVQPKGDKDKNQKWDETQIRYGKLLLESKNLVLKQFLEKEIKKKKTTIEDLVLLETSRAKKRQRELEKELALVQKAIQDYFP